MSTNFENYVILREGKIIEVHGTHKMPEYNTFRLNPIFLVHKEMRIEKIC